MTDIPYWLTVIGLTTAIAIFLGLMWPGKVTNQPRFWDRTQDRSRIKPSTYDDIFNPGETKCCNSKTQECFITRKDECYLYGDMKFH